MIAEFGPRYEYSGCGICNVVLTCWRLIACGCSGSWNWTGTFERRFVLSNIVDKRQSVSLGVVGLHDELGDFPCCCVSAKEPCKSTRG